MSGYVQEVIQRKDLQRPTVIQYCLKRTHHHNQDDGVNVKTARFEDKGMFF